MSFVQVSGRSSANGTNWGPRSIYAKQKTSRINGDTKHENASIIMNTKLTNPECFVSHEQ